MSANKLRVVFMGTPEFAVRALNAVVEAGHEVVCVYTQPPRPSGRGQKVHSSPVHMRAEQLGIPVRCPRSFKKDAEARAQFAALGADVAVVAAYGLILPKEVLSAPRLGCLNIHASLLPRWRGAAPIQRAILSGDKQSGVCIMQMDEGLDTGDVLLRQAVDITEATTATTLHDELAVVGGKLVVDALNAEARGAPFPREKQPEEGVTYAKMLSKEEGRIDWSQPALEIERKLRALHPWPGVWCLQSGQRLKVKEVEVVDAAKVGAESGTILNRHFQVACGTGVLLLKVVQPQNRKAMDGHSFMNGMHLNVGDKLT